jgi:hypothetical protein
VRVRPRKLDRPRPFVFEWQHVVGEALVAAILTPIPGEAAGQDAALEIHLGVHGDEREIERPLRVSLFDPVQRLVDLARGGIPRRDAVGGM